MARRKVWCSDCGQVWMSLRDPHTPDCYFCGEAGTVSPVVPDKLQEKLKAVARDIEGKAVERQREQHERKAYSARTEVEQDALIQSRESDADNEVRLVLGKAEEDPMAPVQMQASAPVMTAPDRASGFGKVRPLGKPPAVVIEATPSQQPAPAQTAAAPANEPLQQIGNPLGLVTETIKGKSSKFNDFFEWLDNNKEIVEVGKQALLQIGAAVERHSQRQAAVRREELALQREMMQKGMFPGMQQQAPTQVIVQAPQVEAPPVIPFDRLPFDERVQWAKRGGINAYYAQATAASRPAQIAAPQQVYNAPYVPAPTASPVQQRVQAQAATMPAEARKPLADANGNARDLTLKGGVAGALEARRALGLPDVVGAAGSLQGADLRGKGPIAPTAALLPAEPAEELSEPTLAPPGAEAPVTDHVEGEEVLPAEMRDLPRTEKEAIILANNIVKEEHAQTITKAIGDIPPEHVRELVANDDLLLNKKLRDVLYLLPEAMRNNKALKGMMDTDLRDLIAFMPEATRAVYTNVIPDRMVAYIANQLPEHKHLHDPDTKAWLTRNLQALKDSMV